MTFANTRAVQSFGAWRRVYLAHDGRERGSAARAVPVFFLDDETPSSVVARSKEGAIGVQRACRNTSAQSRVRSRRQTFESEITRTLV